MKKLFGLVKEKTIEFFKWIWHECKDWHTIMLLGIVAAVLGLPVWCGYLLGFIFGWEWALIVASVMWGFWMLPGAPFFALAVTITLAIKRGFEKKQEKEEKVAKDSVDALEIKAEDKSEDP